MTARAWRVDDAVDEAEARLFHVEQSEVAEPPPDPAPVIHMPAPPDPSPDSAPGPDGHPVTAVTLEVPTVEDIDRLWDWIRQDGAEMLKTMGVTTSLGLHQKMGMLLERSDCICRALYLQKSEPVHVGFGTLFPIIEHAAQTHLYIASQFRRHSLQVAREALRQAKDQWPDLKFCVITWDPRIAKLARYLGLGRQQFMLMEDEDGKLNRTPARAGVRI